MSGEVICKNNEGFEDQLTKGKYYQVVYIQDNSVCVRNDKKLFRSYGMVKFEVVL